MAASSCSVSSSSHNVHANSCRLVCGAMAGISSAVVHGSCTVIKRSELLATNHHPLQGCRHSMTEVFGRFN
jgi:hypothetical protein